MISGYRCWSNKETFLSSNGGISFKYRLRVRMRSLLPTPYPDSTLCVSCFTIALALARVSVQPSHSQKDIFCQFYPMGATYRRLDG